MRLGSASIIRILPTRLRDFLVVRPPDSVHLFALFTLLNATDYFNRLFGLFVI